MQEASDSHSHIFSYILIKQKSKGVVFWVQRFPKSRKLLPVTPRCVDATLSPRLESASESLALGKEAGWLGKEPNNVLSKKACY
jgi:hypothetical protein